MQQCLPIPLPKEKFRSPGDSDEETDEDAPTATPSAGNPEDGDPKVPPVQLSPSQIRFMRLPHGFTSIGTSLKSTGLP